MSQRTENQVNEMKKQTIGVEVEMNNITREKAARLAAEFFGTRRFENTAGRNGYSARSAWAYWRSFGGIDRHTQFPK